MKALKISSILTNSWVSGDEGDPTKGICGGTRGESLDGEPKYTGAWAETTPDNNGIDKRVAKTPFPCKGRLFERLWPSSIMISRRQKDAANDRNIASSLALAALIWVIARR